MMTLQQILWSAMIGLVLAATYTFYTKRVLGSFVKKLLQADALDPESAVSLEELDIKVLPLVKLSLRNGTDFSETVLCSNGRYYIPESKIDKAERKYCGEYISVFIVLIIIVFLFFTALICSYIFPELFAMLGISA